ncbi:gamma-glutamyltransferase [Rhizobium mongolense]|uniref:gamma-glutamyltransferase n=1 Tax=Rhizobium mongolense TaxID=57676 RepID=UPI003556B399
MSSEEPFCVHSSTGFGIAAPVPSATAAANAMRLQGGSVFDMYLAALACAWVTDPANCSPFGRMQGVFSVGAEVGCLNAPTAIRRIPESTVPVPGNIAAWFHLKRCGRLRLPACDLLAPAVALARQGFEPTVSLKVALESERHLLSEPLKAIYLDESSAPREHLQNPELANLLQILAESANEDDFWRILRAGDPGPWLPEETLGNPVHRPVPRMLVLDPNGQPQRFLTTGAIETWGTWTLLGVAVTVELRRRGVLTEFSRAIEAYVLSTILLLDRIPFAVGTLEPKAERPTAELNISSESIAIADRVERLLDAPVEALWNDIRSTYFPGRASWTDDANTNHFSIASGDDFLSFTTSIGPWFGSKVSWWGAALGYSYAMRSNSFFEGQKHDITEMSPLIVEVAGRPTLAIGSAGSERILGSLTYLLFLRFGLGFSDDMADLIAKPRVFPKDGKLRMHADFWPNARAHLEARGFEIAPTGYELHAHVGIVSAVERLDNDRYKSGSDPSSSGSVL